jgi:hypothetical protein
VGFPSSADDIPFPEAIESGDLDGDDAEDLVVVDNTYGNLSVFFNETDPPPEPVVVEDWDRY